MPATFGPGPICPRRIAGRVAGPGFCPPAEPLYASTSYSISGISRDANGNALGGCTVMVFYTGIDKLYTKVVSDANGVWRALVPDKVTQFYAVSYLAGSPDVAGTTVNTLVGS